MSLSQVLRDESALGVPSLIVSLSVFVQPSMIAIVSGAVVSLRRPPCTLC